MFLGEYQHSLDAKGRVILPARFRDQLEGGAVMARGLDGCLDVYPPAEFQRRASEVNEARKRGPRERQAARSFFSGAGPAVPDGQGRVAIPRSEEHTSELQSRFDLVCRLLLEKKKT